MTVEFSNLSDKEKDLIFAIEDMYPECVARDNTAGFDGATILQLFTPDNITQIIAEIIKAVAVIAAARITAKATIKASKEKKDNLEYTSTPIVVCVLETGEKVNVLTEEDLNVSQRIAESAESTESEKDGAQ